MYSPGVTNLPDESRAVLAGVHLNTRGSSSIYSGEYFNLLDQSQRGTGRFHSNTLMSI